MKPLWWYTLRHLWKLRGRLVLFRCAETGHEPSKPDERGILRCPDCGARKGNGGEG